MTAKLKSVFCLIAIIILSNSSLLAINKANENDHNWNNIPCERYFNTEEVTPCECVDLEKTDERLDCIEKKQKELYDFIRNSNKYKVLDSDDLGFSKWANHEINYIQTLDYGNPLDSRFRQILYTQSTILTGIFLFNSHDSGVGGIPSEYLDEVKKYRPDMIEQASFDDIDNLSDDDISYIYQCLEFIMNIFVEELDNPILNESQEYWSEMIENNIAYYTSTYGDNISPQSVEYEILVLQPIVSRINLLKEYLNPDSTFTIDRLRPDGLSVIILELYELMTKEMLVYTYYEDELE